MRRFHLPPRRLPLRAGIATTLGLGARRASQILGRGAGGMFGGHVALKVEPELIQVLSRNKKTVLVTGTNGKSTTTKMTAQAVSTLGPVGANLGGDNMLTGVATALMTDREAPFAVLEVDEMNLPAVAARTKPQVIVLLNLSRDQLDRVGEIGTVEKRLREAVNLSPQATIVANCDDPLIVSAAWDARKVVWVAAGAPWKDDATSFPRTGTLVIREGDAWSVEDDETFQRPNPDWWLTSEDGSLAHELHGPNGFHHPLTLRLPGRANRGNAAQAVAAAVALGAEPVRALKAVEGVRAVAGRYQTYNVDGRSANLLLAKNPAGWQEAQSAVSPNTRQVVIAVNGQEPDGEDLSWLWDVDFAPIRKLGASRVVASGERVADLAVRLEYDGIEAVSIDDPVEAIRSMRPGPVQVLANYTAFRDLKKRIEGRSGE